MNLRRGELFSDSAGLVLGRGCFVGIFAFIGLSLLGVVAVRADGVGKASGTEGAVAFRAMLDAAGANIA